MCQLRKCSCDRFFQTSARLDCTLEVCKTVKGEVHDATYRLQGSSAVVAIRTACTALGLAAGGNVRVVGLLTIGHGVGSVCVSGRIKNSRKSVMRG